jgi:type II secretory pathway pseudopilin PulG
MMSEDYCRVPKTRTGCEGFTLTETVFALLVAVLLFSSVLLGYGYLTDRAEWSARSLAAQSLALQAVEQRRAAQWDTRVWPVVDEGGLTNYAQPEILDLPTTPGQTNWATNFIRVTTISSNPPLRQIRADCVWTLPSRRPAIRGPFTNTAITLRAADQ